MRISSPLVVSAGTLVVLALGCAGPEQKLGRGLSNATELARMGELQRSVEQTALWDGVDKAYTTGVIRGLNRTVARTAIGLYEVVTCPIPPYHPVLAPHGRLWPDPSIRTYKSPYGGLALPEDPVYPDSFKPGIMEGPPFDTDTSLGFTGGEVFPFVPGSKFRIFDD
jgi:putative exosortase-associated protein (TIGR04073 family)